MTGRHGNRTAQHPRNWCTQTAGLQVEMRQTVPPGVMVGNGTSPTARVNQHSRTHPPLILFFQAGVHLSSGMNGGKMAGYSSTIS